MRAALENFIMMDVSPKMAIIGDMRELGESSLEEHQKIVDFIEDNSLENIWLVGEMFAATRHQSRCFSDVENVKKEIEQITPKNYYILIKGSNGMKLSQLSELL